MKKQTLIILLIVTLVGCNIKSSSKIVDVKSDENVLLKELINKYYGDKQLNKNEGIYNIDSTKSNLHTYKDFRFLLKEDGKITKLIFISCEKYGYSHTWSEGELFGVIDSLKDKHSNVYYGHVNEHRGEERKELTPHEIKMDEFEIIVFTGENRDFYNKIYPLK